MMPSMFQNELSLFDGFLQAPWFSRKDFANMERKLYGHRAKNVMNTDIRENEKEFTIEIDLPGFQKEDLSVELDQGYLTIRAVKSVGQEAPGEGKGAQNGRYIRKERYTGTCHRSYYIGEQYEKSDIRAKFDRGILTLNLPKKNVQCLENSNQIAIE